RVLRPNKWNNDDGGLGKRVARRAQNLDKLESIGRRLKLRIKWPNPVEYWANDITPYRFLLLWLGFLHLDGQAMAHAPQPCRPHAPQRRSRFWLRDGVVRLAPLIGDNDGS